MNSLWARLRATSIIVRAVFLLPAAMAAWWFVLKRPSLWLLEKLAYIPLGLLVAPGGLPPVRVAPDTHEWTFNVAVNTYGRDQQTGQMQFVRSLEFTADEDGIAFFAASWFAYLALAGAAGAFTRSQLPRVAKGLGIETAINILSLAAYAYINGYGSVINSPGSTSGYLWLLQYLYHLIYLVVPFAGPFGVALLLHPPWREYLGFLDVEAPPAGQKKSPRPRRA